MRTKTGMSALRYKLDNFEAKIDSTSEGIKYDIYKSSIDTNFQIFFLLDISNDTSYSKNILLTLLEEDKTNDTTSSAEQILSIPLKSYENYTEHSGWYFKMNLDKSIDFLQCISNKL